MNLQHRHIVVLYLVHSYYLKPITLIPTPNSISVSGSGIDFVPSPSGCVPSWLEDHNNPVFEAMAHGVEQGQPSHASNNPRA